MKVFETTHYKPNELGEDMEKDSTIMEEILESEIQHNTTQIPDN